MILEQCKGVHCVDLGESFQTHIDLQNLASIQPRTRPVKFAPNPDLGSARQGAQLAADCFVFAGRSVRAVSGAVGRFRRFLGSLEFAFEFQRYRSAPTVFPAGPLKPAGNAVTDFIWRFQSNLESPCKLSALRLES